MQNCHLVVGSNECPIKIICKIIRESPTFQSNWSTFARELDIPSSRIKSFRQDLQLDKITHSDLIYDLMEEWVKGEGGNARLSQLIRTLEESGENNVGEKLRLEFNLPCKAADENPLTIKWEDVGVAFQEKVMKTLAEHYPKIQFKERAVLEGDVLLQLMTGEAPTLFKTTLPEPISYYIKRTVSTRNIISTTIFQEEETSDKDVFIFEGMDRDELSLKIKGLTSCSNQFKHGTRFVSLNKMSKVDQNIYKTGHPVHVLKKEELEKGRDYRFRWIKSRGEIGAMHRHIDISQDNLAEGDFIKLLLQSSGNHNLPVCIGDTPGMGKSILLAKIGNSIQEAQSDKSVYFIVLSEFIRLIKQNKSSDELLDTAILKALQNTVCANVIGETVLQSMLDSTHGKTTCELLFDGFDEVDDEDLPLAQEILQTVQTSFQRARLWITTRPHFLEGLESSLSLLGYNIRPFTEDDQIEFLTSFWARETSLDSSKIQEFAMHCLKSLKKKMNSKDGDIAGIPLQCLLIGEVFEDDALEYATFQDDVNEISVMPQVEVGTITCLYQELILHKYTKYKSITSAKSKLGEEEMMLMHASLGLELIFPDHFKKLEHLFGQVQKKELLKIGILESVSTSDTPRFIHRTFAEYFVAWFAINKLKCDGGWTKELNNFFLNGILKTKSKFSHRSQSFEFSYPVIVYFVNFLIDSDCSIELVDNCLISYKIPRQLAHSCVNSDHTNLFKFLQQTKLFNRQAAAIFDHDYVLDAIENSSLELVKEILNLFDQHYKFDTCMQIKVLREAVKRGDFSLVEYLIKKKGLLVLIENLDYGAWILLFDCITQTSKHPEWRIEEKNRVIRFLVNINLNYLEEKNDDGLSPLFAKLAHPRIITELVRLGANVFSKDNYGSGLGGTVLHQNVIEKMWSIKDYHSVIKIIPSVSLKQLVQIKDHYGYTPLMSFLSRITVLPETIEIFKESGANFNDEENSLLISAMSGDQDTKIFEQLIVCGADVRWRGGNSSWTLLHAAAEFGNLNAVEVLLDEDSQLGLNVNEEDAEGLTPLNYAIRYSSLFDYGNRYEAGMALYQRGGNFKNSIISEGMTLLHVAAKQGNFHSVRLLTDMKNIALDVNETDGMGNTPLHYCAMLCKETLHGKISFLIAQHLLDRRADPTLPNKFGETPFHTALTNYSLDLDIFHLLKPKTITPELAILILKFIFRISINRKLDNEELVIIGSECAETFGDQLYEFFEGENILGHQANALFDEDVLHHSAENTGLGIFKLALQIFERTTTLEDKIWENLLHKSTRGGKYSIVKYLIQEKEMHKIIKKMTPTTTPTLIYDCLNQTASKLESEIEERMQIMQIICSINPTLSNIGQSGQSSSFPHNMHHRFLNEHAKLIRNASQDLYNFMGSSEDYHSFILGIQEQKLQKLVSVENGEFNYTPLAAVVRKIDIHPNTLDIFRKAGANFNATDSEGYSLLALAISYKRSVETLRKLISCGAKIGWKGIRKNATLLHLAAKNGYLEAVQFLIGEHNMDANAKDKDGLTPLDYGICNSIYNITGSNTDHRTWIDTGMTLKYLGGTFKERYSIKRTLLHIATKRGRAESVELLIYLGMDVNGTTKNGNTPLHLAQIRQTRAQRYNRFHKDFDRITKLLLVNYACPNSNNYKGYSAIDIAFKNKKLELETLLLFKSKTDIAWSQERVEITLKTVVKWKHQLNSFHGKEEFFLLIRELVDRGADVNYVDEDGYSLMYIAIDNRHWKTVKYLVEEKNANVNLKCSESDAFGKLRKLIPLHKAAEALQSHPQMVKCLINHGANVFETDESSNTFLHYYDRVGLRTFEYQSLVENIIPKSHFQLFNIARGDELETTPLHTIAKFHELPEQTLALMHSCHVNFNAVDKNGDSVLAYAVIGKGTVAFIAMLISRFGADPQHHNKNGSSLLHIAVEYGTVDAIKFLLGSQYCDVNGKNLDGNTPLHLAGHDVNKYKILVEMGACINSLNHAQETPLHHFKSLEITKFLIERDADVSQKCTTGRTFLHNYLSDYHLTPSAFHLLVEYIIGRHLTSLFDVNGGDFFQKRGMYRPQKIALNPTPLLLAVHFLNPVEETLRLLHSSGVNFKAEDGDGESILAYAVRKKKSLKFISTLIELGAEQAHLNKKNESLLHIAALHGTADVLKFLLNLKILDVNGKNTVGNTPICIQRYITRKCDILEKIKLLIQNGTDINSTNQWKQTALHIAAHCCDQDTRLDVLTFLISKEGNVFAKDIRGCTFLHNFVVQNPSNTAFHSIVEFLLKKKLGALLITPATCQYLCGSELKIWEITPLDLVVCGRFLEPQEETMSLLHSQNIPVPKMRPLPSAFLQQLSVNLNTADDDEHDVVRVGHDGSWVDYITLVPT